MKYAILPLFMIISLICNGQNINENKNNQLVTEIIILGTLHFNQFHNVNSNHCDFSDEIRQKEFNTVIENLSTFKPDAVLIEREPSQQKAIDSLYQMDNLDFNTLPNGMSEVYQIGFKLAKANRLKTVYGVDHYQSISQNLFENGENLEVFKDSLNAFQNIGRSITGKFLKGEMNINDFLIELNKKENVKMSHRLLFNTPAYVVNGRFKNEENFNDIDHAYIGAEFISLFYERNLKIYTNILNVTRKSKGNRIILIIGQVHVGVLQELIANNPNFKLIEVNGLLNN